MIDRTGGELNWSPDAAFEAGSRAVADLALCHVRLQNDARFVWLILIPRIPGVVELDDLSRPDRIDLLDEIDLAAGAVRVMAEGLDRPIDKLNIAALGNVTAQLHIHVVGRRRDDPLWPDPVWGRGDAEPWPDPAEALARARAALGGLSQAGAGL